MKLIAIGDIHGRDSWKKIVSKESDVDKIVFIGDYFDSLDIKGHNQIHNFKDIIAFKKANPNKVVLLLGNHDFQYLDGVTDRYSGFQEINQFHIREELESAIKQGYIQICCIFGGLMFSHAGVTKTWLVNNGIKHLVNIEDKINDLFKYKRNSFKFTSGKNKSPYGDDVCQSPIWVRPSSLDSNRIDQFTHVVGHTQQNYMQCNNGIVLIDTLGTSGEYLKMDGKKLTPQKI